MTQTQTLTKTLTKTEPEKRQPRIARTIVVGDLHGDSQALAGILLKAGLTDTTGAWAGGTARLIQLGDCIDRGPDSAGVIAALQRLQREAPAGAVVRLAGNHEMELMRGETCYLRNVPSHERLARTLRDDAAAGRLVAAAAVGPWLCVHGGLRSRLRAQLRLATDATPACLAEKLNGAFQAANQIRDFSHPIFGPDAQSGLFWTYGPELQDSRSALQVPHIVGHTITDNAFARGGRVIFLDQGISAAVRGRWSFLEILGARMHWNVRERGAWRRVTRPLRPPVHKAAVRRPPANPFLDL